MSDYEIRRQQRIKQNEALLAELNIQQLVPKRERGARPTNKKRKFDSLSKSTPLRVSARIAATPVKPQYLEADDVVAKIRPVSKRSRIEASPEQAVASATLPEEVEAIQSGWTNWEPTGAAPIRNEDQSFHFDDYPDFQPNKSPMEMLKEGCFGGSYYRPLRSRKLGIVVEGDWKELPSEWIDGLNVDKFLISPEYDADVNKFKVSCGQSIEEWEASGWIRHEYDVRGWFQWYTRFFRGRRCDDDDRQVSRWKKCVGETGRWRRMLLKKYMQLGVREVFDDGADEDNPEVSPVMHQTCHHWAFEVRQEHLDAFWRTGGR